MYSLPQICFAPLKQTNSVSFSAGFSDKFYGVRGGTTKLPCHTDSYKKIFPFFEKLYEKFAPKDLLIRKINVGLNNLVHKDYMVFDMFSSAADDEKEEALQKTVIDIKKKYGKNSLLRGTSFQEKATARERNKLIGGHNGGET